MSERRYCGKREREMVEKSHFVLVHGACHGAWCWYKVKPLLESQGHRVSVLDLTGSGTNLTHIHQVYTFYDYTKPLLDFLESAADKVILVGHSLGGLNLALAMDTFPNKISAAVFLTAFSPDTVHSPSYVLEQYSARTPAEAWRDTQFLPYGSNDQTGVSMFFGPMFMSLNLYQLSPVEDLELGKILIRPSSLFMEDLPKTQKFSTEGFGSVKRVYVVCNEDKAIPVEFQRWMIKNAGIQHVIEIEGADHMPMFSKPHELCRCLSEIATNYA